MKVSEVLQTAHDKIEQRQFWTRYARARTIDDVICHPKSRLAYCFCALGAVDFASPDHETAVAACEFLVKASHSFSVAEVNDYQGHKATLEMFQRAINRAKRAEGTVL